MTPISLTLLLLALLRAIDTKFMLLHIGQKSDEAIRLFFVDVHELYLKVR